MLVSRSEQVLHALAVDVRARHGVRVDILVADLTVEDAATTLREQVGALGLQVDLLINIAGFATAGGLSCSTRRGPRPGDAQRRRRR